MLCIHQVFTDLMSTDHHFTDIHRIHSIHTIPIQSTHITLAHVSIMFSRPRTPEGWVDECSANLTMRMHRCRPVEDLRAPLQPSTFSIREPRTCRDTRTEHGHARAEDHRRLRHRRVYDWSQALAGGCSSAGSAR